MMAEEKNISTAEEIAPVPETTEEAVLNAAEGVALETEEAVAEEAAEEVVAEEAAEEAMVEEAVAVEAMEEAVVEETVAEEAVVEEAMEEADGEDDDISDKLKEAAGNIQKASIDARSRRSEQEKSQKQLEEETQEKIEEIEKKYQEDERLAQVVAEQKLAALDYAQNYRKKLMKDRQKAVSAAKLREKQEKEAEAQRVREEKAKEIADVLEKERKEAHERGEKATALLNRVTKCAVIDEDGKLRLVDRMDLKKGAADEDANAVENEISEEAKEPVTEAAETVKEEAVCEPKSAKPTTVYEYSEPVSKLEAARREVDDFLVGEMLDTDDGKFILNIEDDTMTVKITSDDDPLVAPAGYNPTAEFYAREIAIAKAQHEYILSAIRQSSEIAKSEMIRITTEEQERFNYEIEALNAHRIEIASSQARRRQAVIDEINALVATPVALPELKQEEIEEAVEASSSEDITDREAALLERIEALLNKAASNEKAEEKEDDSEKLEPVINDDPTVLALREMGECADNKKTLKKYLKKSQKAIKRFNKQKSKIDSAVSGMSDPAAAISYICKSLMLSGNVLEIKCDNLAAASRLANPRLTRKCMNSLYSEIEEYNRRVGAFAAITGEELTRVSAFLPERIVQGTGKAIIPVIAFRERYEEEKEKNDASTSYTFTFPSLESLKNGTAVNGYPTVVANEAEADKNNVTVTRRVVPALTEESLVGETVVKNKRQYKKLLKLAKKANKKLDKEISRLGSIDESKDKAVICLAIEKEKALIASRVLIASIELGIGKFISTAKRELIDAFARYNGIAKKCEAICGTEMTAIHSSTVEKIADAKLLPGMPVVLHLTELYETVGEMTRIVGKNDVKNKALDACCTFIFGGAAASTPAPAAAPAINGAVLGAVVSDVPVSRSEAAPVSALVAEEPVQSNINEIEEPKAAVVEVADEKASESDAQKLSEKEFKKYVKCAEKSYKATRKQLDKLNKERKSVEGAELVDVDIKRLVIVKNLIDELADNVAVSATSGQKSYLKTVKKRLNSEIAAHNAIVDVLNINGEITLSKVSENLYKTIVAGEEYYKTPKIEYRTIERAPTQTVHVEEPEVKEVTPKAEYNGKANRAMRVMNKKELKKLLKAGKKENAQIKEDLENNEKQRAVSVGRERVMLVVSALSTQKKAVSLAADNLLAASQVSTSKKEIDKLRKTLDGEIAVYNKLTDEYEEITGDSVTKADVSMSEKIVSGRAYSEIPDLSYAVKTSVYEYDFADYTAYQVKDENDKKLAAAQAHNRVERSNAATYEIAQLSSRVAKQANKDLELIAARFMFEKGLLQSNNDMLTYRYSVTEKTKRISEKEIERRCKELDKNGKEALKLEDADNKRYYAVISNNPEAVKLEKSKGLFAKKYTKDDIIDIRDKVMQLLNERDRLNSKLLSIYTGYEVDMDGNAITLEMRKVKSVAAAKEHKKLSRLAKKVSKLPAEKRDKQKLYDLINTQVDAKSTIALAKYRLKHETLPAHEKKQLKRDIQANKALAKKAASRFEWLFKRIRNFSNDMGGSWMVGTGLLLLIFVGAIVAFIYFFGNDFFGAIGSIINKISGK